MNTHLTPLTPHPPQHPNTPTDTATYLTVTVERSISVVKDDPVITWEPITNIVFGTPLSSDQLDAVADEPGFYTYSPPLGTILPAGTNQLSVIFVPNDTANFNTVTANQTVIVDKAPFRPAGIAT